MDQEIHHRLNELTKKNILLKKECAQKNALIGQKNADIARLQKELEDMRRDRDAKDNKLAELNKIIVSKQYTGTEPGKTETDARAQQAADEIREQRVARID